MCGRTRTPIWLQCAATLALRLRTLAVWLITFTLSRAVPNSVASGVHREDQERSSKWIKTINVNCHGFFWQRGYGVFLVSPSQLDAVLQYVSKQHEHHRARTFQEEYRELLRRHGVDFNERYVWD